MNGADIDLIVVHGTETRDGYYLRRRDVKEVEKELRKLITQLNRLAGKYVVIKVSVIKTIGTPEPV